MKWENIIPKNKQGGFTDIFLFLIFTFILILICAIFIYVGGQVEGELRDKFEDLNETLNPDKNYTEPLEENFVPINEAYGSLYWISVFLIMGMIIAVFMGAYFVSMRPVLFVPYIFLSLIAVVVGVAISNGYHQLIADPTMADTFNNFLGANFIILNLPIWVSVIAIGGGIIMFVRMNRRERF